MNILIINLTVTELMVSAFGIPVDTANAAQKGWKLGSTFCTVYGFVLTALGERHFVLLKYLYSKCNTYNTLQV